MSPKLPLLLGVSGIIPFALLSIALWIVPSGQAVVMSKWLVSYGAVILTFVGALHWGVAMVHPEVPDRDRGLLMVWSVCPSACRLGGAWVRAARGTWRVSRDVYHSVRGGPAPRQTGSSDAMVLASSRAVEQRQSSFVLLWRGSVSCQMDEHPASFDM